ncbi:hypothetical protein [Kitasatospora sp. CB01950]|uniref:hypothetical protein n=1 Tax=Kitasatospora sp. CB01950 TaxID=1703930 RepID=UPI0011613644|nr:hypothetical protein [Kitasatospora sp. CB01950]
MGRRMGRRAAVAALLLAPLLAGCGSSGAAADASAPAADRARAQLQELVDGTTSALTPAVRFADDALRAVPHENARRDNDGTAQLTLRRYVLTKVAEANRPRLLEQVRAYWTGRGWTLTENSADLVGARTPDGTGVTVGIGVPGNVTVVATARVKDPGATEPFGPAPSPLPTGADGSPDTLPRFTDPGWS